MLTSVPIPAECIVPELTLVSGRFYDPKSD